MEMDMSVYLGAFLDEVDEQLQILDEEVLNLENDGENIETIQKIFRAAHTLKGSSAAMGMTTMKELTHKVENVFDAIRNHQIKVNTQIINLIFDSIDTIKLFKEAILNGNVDSVDVTQLIEKLEACKNGADSGLTSQVVPKQEETKTASSDEIIFPEVIFDEYQKDMVEKALEIGMNVMAVYVGLVPNAMLKSVRAFLINNNLKEIGEIIASYPSTEIIEDENKFDGNVVYIIVTESKNHEVLATLNSISDIKSIHLSAITSDNLDSFCKGKKVEIVEQKPAEVNANAPKKDAKLKVNQTVRVDVERLEYLLNLVGELVISQTRLKDVGMRLTEKYSSESLMEDFHEVDNQLGQIVSELHEGMMKTRMLPIEQLFNRFPRMVRDIAQTAQKEVNFVIEGKETELDRNLIDEIADPIIHLLRNALDHGVETPEEREKKGKPRQGTVLLKAAHEENHIVITISDDGNGINTEKLKQSAIKKQQITEAEAERLSEKEILFLIFKSGVSTAAKVTDISGRGVGMDIVRTHIEKLNGLIDIETKQGEGTTFKIKLPLTLAIIRSLLVKLGEKQFAIPLANVQEIIRLGNHEIKTIQNQEVGIVRGQVLPLIRLHNRFNATEDKVKNSKRLLVVIVGLAEKRMGIVVDQTLGNQEIVIKPLGKYIGSPKYIAGATIMGDGKVALILDVASIVLEEGVKNSIPYDQQITMNQNENLIGITSFYLGDEEYGLEIEKVKDIITVPSISPILNSPYSIVGMSNFRGKLISVMDLRKRLGLPIQPITRKSRLIVVEINNELLGLLVDKVTQVLKIDENEIKEAPNYESKVEREYIRGIYHLDDRLMMLINVSQIIDMETLLKLKQEQVV
ncbi:chemotaxis protein CheW [Lysinibacillus sp. BW-2-10]|uniref:chemotaxis protein CheW n=1 Tax=Lysinibacillus sp. BW-2-10 TaxID=2590030 RepID=UPI00117EBD15|nr:chemotaxis protein CheW [Lysinibacillus sp. BW-2-10]TSI07692.1 chemotaxis protein CheA [Lysinibacillus sp. BW-2-10]